MKENSERRRRKEGLTKKKKKTKRLESIEDVEEDEKMKSEEEHVSDPESSGRNVQEDLANLASSLMAAVAAEQVQDGAGAGEEDSGEGNCNNSEAVNALMMMKPLVKKARKLLYRRMRVGVEDSRVFIGKFHCLDKQGNIILYDTVEDRQLSPQSSEDGKQGCDFRDVTSEGGTTEQHSLGLVLIPARCRTSCDVECSLQDQVSLLSV